MINTDLVKNPKLWSRVYYQVCERLDEIETEMFLEHGDTAEIRSAIEEAVADWSR